MIAETVRRVVDREINPFVDEWEAAEQFPGHELFRKLGDLGLLGVKYEEKYGGLSLDFRELTGFSPNTMVVGANVMRVLRNHPDILDRIALSVLDVNPDVIIPQNRRVSA